MEHNENITRGVCKKCGKPAVHGRLCRQHENERQRERREARRTRICTCGAAIAEDSESCRKCLLSAAKGNSIALSPAPRVFAGRWEEWAAMKEDQCPIKARFVERVERGRV